MAAKTGNSYTTGTTSDSVEILMANPGFSTMASLNKMPPSGSDDRQTEMAMWWPKEKILIFLEL